MSIFGRNWDKIGVSLPWDIVQADLYQKSKAPIYLRDADYRSIPLDDFFWLMRKYRRKERDWTKQIFDCDDFAVCFIADMRRGWANECRKNEALAFGYVEAFIPELDGWHAFIWMRDDKGRIHWIEPQTNNLLNCTPESIRIFEG